MPDPTPRDAASVSRRRLLVGGAMLGTTVAVASSMGDRPVRVRVVREPAPPPAPIAVAGAAPLPGEGHVFDRVIRGGRVIDPDSGYDAVADVGIDGGSVASISEAPLQGRATIDAAGLVVSPGFIDILSYEPWDYGIWYKVADGVTANVGMHGLNMMASDYFATFARDDVRPPVHHGGAFDHPFMRQTNGMGADAATPSQIDQLRRQLDEGIADGWLGLDVEPEYTPWVTTDEIVALATVAQAHGLPVFFHARYSSPDEPGADNATAIGEVLRVARETGAAVHIEHLTSTGGTFTMQESLATLEAARAEGLDVTACCYPYDFWATYAASARFGPGWQERYRITYADLEVPGSDEPVTEATWPKLQAENALVAAHAIPEDDVRAALRTPWIMLGSDGILEEGDNNHPRATGTFARTLGHYVREEQVLTLREALAKMTILPARRLENGCSAMARKGRLQIGADADVTIFDPDEVAATSTVDDPAQESVGIEWVLVGGTPVKTPDGIDRSQRNGTALTSDLATA